MIRQTGLALGVSVLVAVVGTGAAHHGAGLVSFQHAGWLSAAICMAGIVRAPALLGQPRPVPVIAPVAAPVVALAEV